MEKASNRGGTPLFEAANLPHFGIVSLLIHSGADASRTPPECLLSWMRANLDDLQEGPHLLLNTVAAKPGVNWLVHLALQHDQKALAETVRMSLV